MNLARDIVKCSQQDKLTSHVAKPEETNTLTNRYQAKVHQADCQKSITIFVGDEKMCFGRDYMLLYEASRRGRSGLLGLRTMRRLFALANEEALEKIDGDRAKR